jgi:hypothetical protein
MSSSVQGLVVAYAMLFALVDLVVLIPGDSVVFFSGWSLAASVLIQGLLVWRLAHGSALAWMFGLLLALGTVALLFLMGGGAPFELAVIFIVVFSLMQAAVLLSSPVRGFVDRTPPAAA